AGVRVGRDDNAAEMEKDGERRMRLLQRSGEAATIERPAAPLPLTGTAQPAEDHAPAAQAVEDHALAAQAVEAQRGEGALPARLFINRTFAIYTAGSFISATGSWFQVVALGWLVVSVGGSHSGFLLGLVG